MFWCALPLSFQDVADNIDSLVVSPGLDGKFARMNIVAHGNPETLEQIILQLEKLVDVLHATDHTGHQSVEKELALLKVGCSLQDRTELLQLVHHFKAKTVDMTENSMIIQVTGDSDKIDAIRANLNKFELIEFIRTGKVIMVRGKEHT